MKIEQGRKGEEGTGAARPLAADVLVVYVISLALCALDLLDGKPSDGDIDDILRAIQIRWLLSPAGHWWDLTLPMIGSPEPYVSPWSRLVDLPYVAIAGLLSPWLGQDRAISVSFMVWPPLLLGVYSLLAAIIFRALSPGRDRTERLLLAAATTAMMLAVWEFVPGRIDHHNLQIVALMTALAGLFRHDRWGGILIGLGCLASVAIAPEGIPFIVTIFGGLLIASLTGNDRATKLLSGACLSLLFATLPTALVLLGPKASLSTQCDAFSAPYILLVMGCAGILLAVSTWLRRLSVPIRLLAAALAGTLLMGAFGFAFPVCLDGPYWMIDPLSKALWFDRVAQEQSFLGFAPGAPAPVVMLLALHAAATVLALPDACRRMRRGDPAPVILVAVAALSLILTLIVVRYIRFPFAFASLLIPLACRTLSERPARPVHLVSWRSASQVVAAALLVAALAIHMFRSPMETPFDAIDRMAFDSCPRGDFSALATLPPGHILAPGALALSLAASSMPAGMTVGALPYHRASPGLRRAFQAFAASDTATRRDALTGFDYVAVCRFPLEPDGTAPLYDALSAGRDWPGLARLPTAPGNPFQIFRIDHAAVQ